MSEHMTIDKKCETLDLLFQAFCKQYNYYVLGAGASARIIPMTQTPNKPDDIFNRIIGNPSVYDDPMTAKKNLIHGSPC